MPRGVLRVRPAATGLGLAAVPLVGLGTHRKRRPVPQDGGCHAGHLWVVLSRRVTCDNNPQGRNPWGFVA
jgi:hypothetical protein